MIPYGRQNLNEADLKAVMEVLQSDFLTQGPMVPAFEKAVAEYCGARHAICVNSATSALHLACMAVGVGEGDIVWTVPNTFVASANCARYCGATPDFVDIDPNTLNLSVRAFAEKLEKAKSENRIPKAIIPVDFGGQSCEMEAIADLARAHEIAIIEDASHAVGGEYQGRKVGSGEFADITVFSFHPVKIITTAEGGMLLCNDPALAQKIELLRSHGVTRDPGLMQNENHGPWYYEQVTLGYNYRMTDVQAALGLSQMTRLDEFVSRRRELATRYEQLLADLPLMTQVQHPDALSAWHLFVIQLDDPSRRRSLFEEMREKGIGVNVHYIPVHLQPDFRGFGFQKGDYPVAESYYAGAITLPLHPALSEEEQLFVVDAVRAGLAS